MWLADIYCDLEWVRERRGVLGEKRFRLSGAKSQSLDIAISFHLFGDDQRVRHVRVLMDTDDEDAAQRCADLNIQIWVQSLEVAVTLATRRPFSVARLPGTTLFPVSVGRGEENSPAPVLKFPPKEALPIDYKGVAFGMAAWSAGVEHHLFYLRRFIDDSFPLDVRWLNGYRLLEWHFVGRRAGLAKSPAWRTFVDRFRESLAPHLRRNQTAVGLLEEPSLPI